MSSTNQSLVCNDYKTQKRNVLLGYLKLFYFHPSRPNRKIDCIIITTRIQMRSSNYKGYQHGLNELE